MPCGSSDLSDKGVQKRALAVEVPAAKKMQEGHGA